MPFMPEGTQPKTLLARVQCCPASHPVLQYGLQGKLSGTERGHVSPPPLPALPPLPPMPACPAEPPSPADPAIPPPSPALPAEPPLSQEQPSNWPVYGWHVPDSPLQEKPHAQSLLAWHGPPSTSIPAWQMLGHCPACGVQTTSPPLSLSPLHPQKTQPRIRKSPGKSMLFLATVCP